MFSITWKILDLFEDAKGVKYLASITDGKNTIETEGNYWFPEGKLNLPFDQIKEQNLIELIDKDAIESNLQIQLEAINNYKKVDFPWLAGTFTIE